MEKRPGSIHKIDLKPKHEGRSQKSWIESRGGSPAIHRRLSPYGADLTGVGRTAYFDRRLART